MDPVSEMEARNLLSSYSMKVVGWYHTHPGFVPSPSVRDLENQRNYQRLFEHQGQADAPFVGVILSPYDSASPSAVSQYSMFHCGTEIDTGLGVRMLRWVLVWLRLIFVIAIPYQPQFQLTQDDWKPDDVIENAVALAEKYCRNQRYQSLVFLVGSDNKQSS